MTFKHARTFTAVFLAVFLGGLGVSGAAALWAQQATVTTQVTTGTWGLQAGWPWDARIGIVRTKDHGERDVEVTWTAPPSSGTGSMPTYRATLSGTHGFQTIVADHLTTTSYEFSIVKNDDDIVYTVTVASTLDGVTSTPVSRSFRVHPNGDILRPTP